MKTIVTCAVTGASPVNPRHPAFPVTPDEIAASAVEAANAGAAIVHLHVRDPETGEASRDPELFRQVTERVRSAETDVVLNLTCGGGGRFFPSPENEGIAGEGSDIAPAAERVQHAVELRPEVCSLDITTLNEGEGDDAHVYLNTHSTLREMARLIRKAGVKPELEVFQPGDILFGKKLMQEGLLDEPPLFQFVLGVKWGAPADTETMTYMRNLLPENAKWCAFGISRLQMPMVAQAVLLGGNVRVGLEDNLYLRRGVFATNGQLVERAVQIVECLGGSIASPEEARQILSLGR